MNLVKNEGDSGPSRRDGSYIPQRSNAADTFGQMAFVICLGACAIDVGRLSPNQEERPPGSQKVSDFSLKPNPISLN